MMGLAEFLPALIGFVIFWLIVALFIFALIGIQKVHSDYKESKWQKKYGDKWDKLEEDSERNEWENIERLRDKVFLLEEVGTKSNIDKIKKIISEVDYEARYNTWKKNETKWKFYSYSSMAGGLGSSEKAQAEVDEDFIKYDKQRKQELRDKLNKTI